LPPCYKTAWWPHQNITLLKYKYKKVNILKTLKTNQTPLQNLTKQIIKTQIKENVL